MRIAIADVQVPFMRGGAELHADGLMRACEAAGHQAELIRLPFRFFPHEDMLRCIEAWKAENLRSMNLLNPDRVIALRFPAYCVPFSPKKIWLLHQHRAAYDLWNPQQASAEDRSLRETVIAEDNAAFAQVRDICTNSSNVSARLKKYNGIDSAPLYHPPPLATRIYSAAPLPYIFAVGRLETLKRLDLLIRAMARLEFPLCALIAGRGTQSGALEQLVKQLGVGHRVKFLGALDEAALLAFYARSLAVFFAPYDEDYGYVTLEAMLAAKPVITCTDSGGPLEFVIDGETGRVVEPSPEAIADAIEMLCSNRSAARMMGEAGLERYHRQDISWDRVLQELLA